MLKEAGDRLDALEGVDGRAVYGLAGEELAAFGREVDLLVVGSRGYGPVSRLILGSTSEYLQRSAPCPLLVLPRSTAERDHVGRPAVERDGAPPAAVEQDVAPPPIARSSAAQ